MVDPNQVIRYVEKNTDLADAVRLTSSSRVWGSRKCWAASSSLSARARCSRIRSRVILWRCSTYLYPPNIPLCRQGRPSLED
jgi:hypothetical protein